MEWLRRIGAAIGSSLIWAAVWAGVGALIAVVDSGGSMDSRWLGPPIGMSTGFLAGVIFSTMLGSAASGRRLDDMAPGMVVACGGIAGLLVGALPFAINQPPSGVPLWQVLVAVIGSMALMGAASAAGSLALARTLRHLRSPNASVSDGS